MTRKDNDQKKPINPILTDPEQARVNAGGNLFSERLGKLLVAWNADFRNVIFTLGKHVENQSELPWLESLSDIIVRLGKSFEYIVSDCEGLKEFGGEVLSYEYGLQSILDWTRITLSISAGSNSPMAESGDEIRRLVLEIQSCMMALIAQGNIPNKKMLRLSALPGKDGSNFTKILKGMAIQPLLPNEAKGRKVEDSTGTFHPGSYFHYVPHHSTGEENENHILVGRSLKPTGNRQMVDVEIRRIKESLGPVYHILLLQFGMRELQSTDDLRVFECRLAKLGLELK